MVDIAGKPLAGVPVSLLGWGSGNGYSVPVQWRPRFTATSAADGGWTLPGVPHAGEVMIGIGLEDDDRYALEEKTITLAADKPANPVQLIAYLGASLTGRVLSAQGTPVADVMVSIKPAYANLRTEADGSYHFSRLVAEHV